MFGVSMKLSEDLHPLSELKSSASSLIDAAQETGRPQVITRYGKAAAVLLSVEAFEALAATVEHAELVAAIAVAEDDVRAGRLVPHAEVLDTLQRWADEDG